MSTEAPSLGRLFVRTFLWLPPCFAAWYLGAPYHAAIAGQLARVLVDLLHPGIVSSLEQPGIDLAFVTTVEVEAAPGRTGVLVPEINPLLYTYGLALFLALMLAAGARAWKIALGVALLLPFQGWGIAFDFLAQVSPLLEPAVAAKVGLSGWRRESVALGYQMGSLILPSLAPVVLWAALSPRAAGVSWATVPTRT